MQVHERRTRFSFICLEYLELTVVSCRETKETKEHKPDDDELNDVAAMGGVNLNEESAKLATASEIVGTQMRSVDDHAFIPGDSIRKRVMANCKWAGRTIT